jgi:DNA-3-methyladenine glycosylase II
MRPFRKSASVTRPSQDRPRDRNAYEIDVVTPFRLDLTVSVLRRFSTNIVDLFTRDGEYVRALPLPGDRETMIARVKQSRADALAVHFEGGDARDHRQGLVIVRRVLGADRDVSRFDRAARHLPWLKSLAVRMRGVKPPRYPTLWEACVNSVLFQQLSLVAASSISRRLTLALGRPAKSGSDVVHSFPSADRFQRASDAMLRSAGLSANKLATLRRVAQALHAGVLDESTLDGLPSARAAAMLCEIKGIGPWTATLILLRGLGRLDVFPMNDSSVVRNLAFVTHSKDFKIGEALTALGPQRGMLYYYLLLSRLEARGDLGRASFMLAA